MVVGRLAAIAYSAGYSGSLIYALCSQSPEVAEYQPRARMTFRDGTAHEYGEQWFNHLHSLQDSTDIDQARWSEYVTQSAQTALQSGQLVMFRCHPNVAAALNFIENLRVIYLSHANKYIPQRWAYEKVIKQSSDEYYQDLLDKWLPGTKISQLNQRLRRALLIKQFNYQSVTVEDLTKQLPIPPHTVNVEQILALDYQEYVQMCEYLEITAIENAEFCAIITTYNSQQWKRF